MCFPPMLPIPTPILRGEVDKDENDCSFAWLHTLAFTRSLVFGTVSNMAALPPKVADRLNAGIKRFQPIGSAR